MNILKICISLLELVFFILAAIKAIKIYKYKKESMELDKLDEPLLWIYLSLSLITATIFGFI